ncbi:MAG: thioredoxin [Bacteroidetes bacterium]|nr:MAG: thioredoxin [Bacteroidota bacterium]
MFDFQKQVIERSFLKPVLVDFWAPWCGPCRVLGPVLEQLAEEQKDRWELVKINTEEHPELAQRFRVMSIPNVKLFHKGKVVDEFAGALSRPMIERWLDEHLPDETTETLQDILALAEGWPDPRVVDKLRRFLQDHPDRVEARVALAKHLVLQDPAEALELVEGIGLGSPHHDDAQDIRALAQLLQFESENGGKAAAALLEAKAALKAGDGETAIRKIIDATMYDKTLHDDLPRRSAIALFHFWGDEHPLTRTHRRTFDMVLY